MKTTVKAIALTLALAALPGLAQMGIYSFGIGPFNNASNSNYTTTTGYYAGGGAQGDSRTSLYGSMAGLYSAYVQRSVGIGAGAFYMASNCYDCVAIGDGAGAKWRNRTGWVQIGDAFAYTNGYLDIKAPTRGARIGPLRFDESDMLTMDGGITAGGSIVTEMGVSAHEMTVESGITAESISASYVFGGETLGAQTKIQIGLEGDTYGYYQIRVDAGGLAVYTNGVFAGYLTITPPAAGNQ